MIGARGRARRPRGGFLMVLFMLLTACPALLAQAEGTVPAAAPSSPQSASPPSSQSAPPGGRAIAIEVRFVGTRGIGGSTLRSSLEPWLEDLVATPDDLGAREDLVYEVTAFYRKSGFPHATATIVEISPIGDDPAKSGGATSPVGRILEVRIDEGARAYLDEILITGNRIFEDGILEGTFPWPRLGLLPGGRPIFTEEALEGGIASIGLLYSLEGYLSAEVTERVDRRAVTVAAEALLGVETAPEVEEIRVKVVVAIEEGPRTTLGEIVVDPGSGLDDATLRAFTGVAVGSPVTPRLGVEVRSRVRRALQDRGYYRARVRVDLEELEGDRRRVRLAVEEGLLHSFGAITVLGDPRTRRSFIRARLGIDSGDRYSTTALEDGQRVLNATGLFARLDLDLVPTEDDPQLLDVVIDVKERDAIRFETRVGFSTYELGRFGAGALHRNLFGTGVEGRLEGLVSFKGEEIEARLRYPFLFEKDVSIELRGKFRRFEEVSFERRESLATILLSFPVDRRLSLNTGFEARDEDLTRIDPTAPEIDESSRAHVLFVGGRHDDRDSAITTTEGFVVTGRVEYSDEELGSDLDFVRLTLRGSYTWRLAENWGLVVAAQTGFIDRIDSGEVPLGERFFLGGPRSVRSFRKDRMAPRDAFGNEIGGEAFAVGSIELRRRLFGSMWGAMFIDAGSLAEDVADYAGENWRGAAGLGWIWNSPVGPIRFDAAATLNPEGEDDDWAVHILLGQPF